MSAGEVAICNNALLKLGAARITSLSDGSNEANLCALRYADCRDYVLQLHPWNCAIRRAILSPLTEVPAFGGETYYQLPTDCLRVLPDDHGEIRFRIEGGRILAGGNTLHLRYLCQLTDTTLYPPHLAEVIAYYLSFDISYALVQSSEKQKLQYQVYQDALRRARFLDSSESRPEHVRDDLLLMSRFGGIRLR